MQGEQDASSPLSLGSLEPHCRSLRGRLRYQQWHFLPGPHPSADQAPGPLLFSPHPCGATWLKPLQAREAESSVFP